MAAASFDIVSRGFGYYVSLISLVLFAIGLQVGIFEVNKEIPGYYGVSIIFLVNFVEYFQWMLRQIITTESLMISS